MERALLDLVGIGLVLFADSGSDGPMAHSRASGSELIRRCISADLPDIASLVERVAASLWTELNAHSINELARETAMSSASTILQRHSPSAAALAAARAVNCEQARCDAANAAVARLTECTLAAALIEGSIDHAGVHFADARGTLAALFRALLAEASSIEAIAPAILAAATAPIHRASPNSEQAAWHDDALDEHADRIAFDLGLPRALIDALVATKLAAGIASGIIVEEMDESVAEVVETLDELRRLSDLVGSDDHLEERLLDVARLVREGHLETADAVLADIVPTLRAPSAARDDARNRELLIGAITTRGRIAGHRSAWRFAAQNFHCANRACPVEDRVSRWRLKLEEARALTRLAAMPGARFSVLGEAAQVYAEAGGITSESEFPLEWAEANLELGAVLLRLGDRQCRPERFLAAALHFKPALDVLTRERCMDGWARGQIGLAHALRGQGTFQGDVVILGDAVFAYRAALGVLTRGMTPALWQEANATLGETLVRIAEETGDLDRLQEAIDILMPLVAPNAEAVNGRSRTIGELALGRGMLLLAEFENSQGDDGAMLDEALALVSGALSAPVEHLNALERARGQRARGTILGFIAQAAGSARLMGQAVDAKRRARDLYLALENEPDAEQIDRDLEILEEAVVALEDEASSTQCGMTGSPVSHHQADDATQWAMR
ncbi:MAG: hypothetical protein JNM89_14850 [Hyphomicrobiaceae bacterium]|nr:hypothetical protein [Hyphomicrobiaceae bacterium]